MIRNEWRNSFNQPKLWIIDAKSSIVLLAAFMHLRYWTIAVAVFTVLFLAYFEHFKRISLPSALRFLVATYTNRIVGMVRPCRNRMKQNYYIDNEDTFDINNPVRPKAPERFKPDTRSWLVKMVSKD